MPRPRLPRIVLPLLLILGACTGWPAFANNDRIEIVDTPKPGDLDLEKSDWLIARRGGEWELVRKGGAGRVEKSAPNEEVLRLGENKMVLVLSMPPLGADDDIQCSEKDRRDYRKPCASAFLVCEKDPGNFFAALWAGVSGGAMADARNRYSCHLDTAAILNAAKAVGMIKKILPVNPQ